MSAPARTQALGKGEPNFCGEPTADGDEAARALRDWYEAHRESWSERQSYKWPPRAGTADNFMLELLSEAERIIRARNARRRKYR